MRSVIKASSVIAAGAIIIAGLAGCGGSGASGASGEATPASSTPTSSTPASSTPVSATPVSATPASATSSALPSVDARTAGKVCVAFGALIRGHTEDEAVDSVMRSYHVTRGQVGYALMNKCPRLFDQVTSEALAAAAPGANPLYCSTVVDETGWNNGPLTAERSIAILQAMVINNGFANIPAGTPTADDTTLLDTGNQDLRGFDTTGLASDANAFVSDDDSYGGDGAVDVSYGKPLLNDILTLGKDCPGAAGMAVSMLNGK